MHEFIPGQRWISNAELQLGLGTLVSVEHRIITIDFVASDEIRTYAKENAPLTRVIYEVGDDIKSISGLSVSVESIIENNGLIHYQGILADGQPIMLAEIELDHFIQFNRPAERFFIGQVDKNHWFQLRYQTLQYNNLLSHNRLFGLIGCRTSLLEHQLYIAHEVANRHAPRVLLADEVGLGKTIEAGLIIHHQLLNEHAQRVLIIVPESLLHQWLVEMLRRFNLMFSVFDEQRCQASEDGSEDSDKDSNTDNENPFVHEQLVLCSLEFLTDNPEYCQQALGAQWDVLVVDEAHHLQWDRKHSSSEYQLIEQFTACIKSVLLLTATPEQLGIESHFARLRLLDPDRFSDLDAFIAEEASYQPIAHAMQALLNDQEIDSALQQTLKHILPNELSLESTDKAQIIKHMLDRHGTGRVLFRNTRAMLDNFPKRELIAQPLALPSAYDTILMDYSQQFVQGDSYEFSALMLFPELIYQLTQQDTDQHWTDIDPRVSWLAQWLKQRQSESLSSLNNEEISNTDNKTLVIAANAATAIDLADTLKFQYGIVAAVFHEGLSLIERDRNAAFFADTDNGSSVLICSEIGSEGRNFQFAHQMVLFDLPLNPDLLEQRIGRLDRIGQTQTIKIHVPYLQGSSQELLFNWYHQGLNAFTQTSPASHQVFRRFQTQLEALLMQLDKPQNALMSNLLQESQQLHKQLSQDMHDGRDRLLEYNSCRQPEAHQLQQLAEQQYQSEDLHYYLEDLFDVIGIEHSDHSSKSYIIQPGEHMISQFPNLPDDGMTITYDRATALSNEDIHFFSWEHPMVRTAMEMISSSEMGNTAITTLDSALCPIRIQPGSLLLECVFILETTAHKQLQAHRYLPSSNIRILINEQGENISSDIEHDHIVSSEFVKKKIARQVIKMKEDVLRKMVNQAEQFCLLQSPKFLQQAKQNCHSALMDEVERLQALSKINANIRPEEIDFYLQQLDALNNLFDTMSPRLDSLRAIIVT